MYFHADIEGLRAALKRHEGRYAHVAAAAGVNYWWLTKFAQGAIRSPGVENVRRLNAFIAGEPEARDKPPPGG